MEIVDVINLKFSANMKKRLCVRHAQDRESGRQNARPPGRQSRTVELEKLTRISTTDETLELFVGKKA